MVRLTDEVKSVLGIKDSYSIGKSPKIFTNRNGQAGGGGPPPPPSGKPDRFFPVFFMTSQTNI